MALALLRATNPGKSDALDFMMECVGGQEDAELVKLLGYDPTLMNLTVLQGAGLEPDEEVYEGLAMLGFNSDFPALVELHAAVGKAHLIRSVEVETSAGDCAPQSPESRALFAKEDELKKREEELAAREEELKKQEMALIEATAAPEPATTSSPRAMAVSAGSPDMLQDAAARGQLIVDDQDLRDLFATYDSDGSGYITMSEFKEEYRQFEDFGLPYTDSQIDRIFSQFSGKDNKLSYEEFCILMLQRAML